MDKLYTVESKLSDDKEYCFVTFKFRTVEEANKFIELANCVTESARTFYDIHKRLKDENCECWL